MNDMKKVLDYVEGKIKEENIELVHGIEKRKLAPQKFKEELESFLERQDMKDNHMRNSQLKPGYNVQIRVNSEYVVGVDIFQGRNDIATLIPFLERMKLRIGRIYQDITAYSGYESEENYLYIEDNG